MVGRGSELAVAQRDGSLQFRVPDDRVSSKHLRIWKARGCWFLEDSGSKNGTFVNGERRERAALADGDLIEAGCTFFLFREGERTEPSADSTPPPPLPHTALRTLVPPLDAQFAALARAAASDLPVLIVGKTGTGKEVTARAVHELSRRAGPFVAVNCGALPETLVESELFGYRKGAFSGAAEDRPGLIRSAEGGTLLLDEIGDLPLQSQAALLRVLQEREVTALGSTRPVAVDVRIVAATNRDLQALVEEGRFRRDLLARLATFQVTLPPLRERREDVGWLIETLLRGIAGGREITFGVKAARALLLHDWPLNIRGLKNALSSALVMAGGAAGDVIEPRDLPEAVRATPSGDVRQDRALGDAPLADVERQHVLAVLERTGWQKRRAATILGISRPTLDRKIREYGLKRPERGADGGDE